MTPKRTSNGGTKTARKIDQTVEQTYNDFESRFAIVTKARANVWITSAVVLFVIGFVVGLAYLADPNTFLQGSINSSESDAAFLRSGGTTYNSTTNNNPTGSTNSTNTQSFAPTLTVTPQAGRAISNSTSVTTRFNLNWNCNLPSNLGEGRLVKKVLNTTAWITDGKIGEYYTEITTTISSNPDQILRGSWIALTCTPQTGEPVTLRCDVTPASQVGQSGTTNCRNSSGSITGCTRNLQTVAATPTSGTIANGSTTTFAVRVTNNDTAACGPSAFTMSHAPNDGTSNLWNFKNYSPFAAVINPGSSATFNVPVSPWDHNPGQVPYLFSSTHSLTTSTQSQYLSCDLIANSRATITVTAGSRQQGERDISGIHSPGCSTRPTDALNSTGGYYTGPDDGSLDDSERLAAEAQAAAAGQRVRGGIVPIIRNTGIYKAACRAVYGRNSTKCQ